MLGSSREPLAEGYDLAMLDLDGVVYIGGESLPGAAEHLAAARTVGTRLAFITNNASRPAAQVAAHLRALGIEAEVSDVVTSAQAAARVLVDRFGPGAAVVSLGAEGLSEALEAVGLVPVSADDEAVAIASGYGPQVLWADLMRAAVRIRDGLPWVASNTDATIPTAFGVAPGHGLQVDMLRRFSGVDPVVAGKPERPLLDETVRRTGARRPLMVGDRLDTDIEGARRIGLDSLLVLTGVTGLPDLIAAPASMRPTYIAPDLGGLLTAHPVPELAGDTWRLGGWAAQVRDDELQVSGEGDSADWWRVVAAASWTHLDQVGEPVRVSEVEVPGR